MSGAADNQSERWGILIPRTAPAASWHARASEYLRSNAEAREAPARFADANHQSRASGEEEIGIPIAETIGGMQRNRRGFDVKPFEEFARTANG